MKEIYKEYHDLNFAVVGRFNEGDYRMDFIVYAIEGVDTDGKVYYHKKDSPSWPDSVELLSEAEIFMHGSVKWDGCSNWHIDEQDRVMIHGCSRENLTAIGEIMARCWDLAAETIPSSIAKDA